MQNGGPMLLLRFLWLMAILFSPIILIAVVVKIGDFVDPQRAETRRENKAIWMKTLPSEQFSDAVSSACQIYIDNKTLWDECFTEVFNKQLMINNYKFKFD